MHMDLGLWFAAPNGHQQGLQREICIGAALHRPTDHPPRKQVDHDRQIQEPLVGADVGNVGDPELVRRIDIERPVQGIVRHDSGAATVRSGPFFVTNLSPYACQTG